MQMSMATAAGDAGPDSVKGGQDVTGAAVGKGVQEDIAGRSSAKGEQDVTEAAVGNGGREDDAARRSLACLLMRDAGVIGWLDTSGWNTSVPPPARALMAAFLLLPAGHKAVSDSAIAAAARCTVLVCSRARDDYYAVTKPPLAPATLVAPAHDVLVDGPVRSTQTAPPHGLVFDGPGRSTQAAAPHGVLVDGPGRSTLVVEASASPAIASQTIASQTGIFDRLYLKGEMFLKTLVAAEAMVLLPPADPSFVGPYAFGTPHDLRHSSLPRAHFLVLEQLKYAKPVAFEHFYVGVAFLREVIDHMRRFPTTWSRRMATWALALAHSCGGFAASVEDALAPTVSSRRPTLRLFVTPYATRR
jgi:hypothetical protein